ncbi:MAG: hypothetical protein ACK4KV_21385 [Rhodocyclaceae bacterium]
MPTYTVRTVILWSPRQEQKLEHLYEERITAWNADSLEEAIDLAEEDAIEYAKGEAKALDVFQGYWLFDEIGLIPQGAEVFSLLRESDLDETEYVATFFETGFEHQGTYGGGSTEARSRQGIPGLPPHGARP